MNNIFKVIFSKTLQAFVVVSELAKGHVKSKSSSNKKSLDSLIQLSYLNHRENIFSLKIADNILKLTLISFLISGAFGCLEARADNDQVGQGSMGGGSNVSRSGVITLSGAIPEGDQGVALGMESRIAGTSSGGVVLGYGSEITKDATNALALGSYSKAREGNIVSFGDATAGLYRRLVNISYAKDDYDAISFGQFKELTRTNFHVNDGTGHQAAGDATKNYGLIGELGGATGVESLAAGVGAKSSGGISVAIGKGAESSGEFSSAIGYNSTASEEGTSAFGYLSKATGKFSTAIGNEALVSGLQATAIGTNSKALGKSATAIGDTAKAVGVNSISIGASTNADVSSGEGSVALGYLTQSTGINALGIGTNAKASWHFSVEFKYISC